MIKYKKIKRGAVDMHAQQLSGSRCTSKNVALLIEQEIGIPAIRVMSVLSAVSEIVARQISEGNSVEIKGLGVLKLGVSMENGKAAAKRLLLQPSSEIKQALSFVEFEEITD